MLGFAPLLLVRRSVWRFRAGASLVYVLGLGCRRRSYLALAMRRLRGGSRRAAGDARAGQATEDAELFLAIPRAKKAGPLHQGGSRNAAETMPQAAGRPLGVVAGRERTEAHYLPHAGQSRRRCRGGATRIADGLVSPGRIGAAASGLRSDRRGDRQAGSGRPARFRRGNAVRRLFRRGSILNRPAL